MEYTDETKLIAKKSTNIISFQDVNPSIHKNDRKLCTGESDKKLQYKPVVILQKLRFSDFDKLVATCPGQPDDVKNFKQKSKNLELIPAPISNAHDQQLSKNLKYFKGHSYELIETSKHSEQLSNMNPDNSFTSETCQLSKETRILLEYNKMSKTIEHNDNAQTVPLNDDAQTVHMDDEKALTVPEDSEEALMFPEDGEEALTVPEDSKEALTVPKDGEEALTVPEDSKEAGTVPKDGEEALTVPGHSDRPLALSGCSDEHLSELGYNDETLTVLEHSDEAPMDTEHTAESLLVPEHCGGAIIDSERSFEALRIPEHSDEVLMIPDHSDEPLMISDCTDDTLMISEHNDKAVMIQELSDKAVMIPEHSDEALLVTECSDETQPAKVHCNEALMVSDEHGDKAVVVPEHSSETPVVPEHSDDAVVILEHSEDAPVISEHSDEAQVVSELSGETPMVHQEPFFAPEYTNMAEVVHGVVDEQVSADQTEDSLTDVDLVYQTLKMGHTDVTSTNSLEVVNGSNLGLVSKSHTETSLLSEVNSSQKSTPNQIDDIGSKEIYITLQTSELREMSIDSKDLCFMQSDMSTKVQEALAAIENSGSIDQLKRSLLESVHIKDPSPHQTSISDNEDLLTSTSEEQQSAPDPVENAVAMIDDTVVFDDGLSSKLPSESSGSLITEQQGASGDVTKEDVVLNNKKVCLDCVENVGKIAPKAAIVDYDEIEESDMNRTGTAFQELVKYDISDDDCFQGSDSDIESKETNSENLHGIISQQRDNSGNKSGYDNYDATEVDSLNCESTEEITLNYYNNDDLEEFDTDEIKSEHSECIDQMPSESTQPVSQIVLSNEEQSDCGSSQPVALEPEPIKPGIKDELQEQNALEEGAPHFYLVGDDLVSLMTANIPSVWSESITIISQDQLTLSEVPSLLKKKVAPHHLNQRQPVYFVCFVGLFNFIQLESRDCMRVTADSPTCSRHVVSLVITSRGDAECQIRSEVTNIKEELTKLVAGEHFLIVPDIQLIDLCRYQKYLDKVHNEVYDHEIPHSESAQMFNLKIALDLVEIIVYLNEIIKEYFSFVDKKLPWLLSLWQIEKPFNRNKLRKIPVTDGYLLTSSATRIVTDCIVELLEDYTKPEVSTSLERVYFIGDPRLSSLTPHWHEKGVEIVVINDGNLIPSMVVQKIRNECENLDRSLVVICFSMKSHVIIKTLPTCKGHDPCKYVVYQDINVQVAERKTLSMIEVICKNLENSSLSCDIALSPLLPVNYLEYRNVIEMRHLRNTGHSITGKLPGPDISNMETRKMVRDIGISRTVMTSEMKRRDFSVLDIPSCILDSDVIASTAELVNGMSLTPDMSKKIVGITVALVDLLNNLRKTRKMNTKLAKYRTLRESAENALTLTHQEQLLGDSHSDRSFNEDSLTKLRERSQHSNFRDAVNNEAGPSNRIGSSMPLHLQSHLRNDDHLTNYYSNVYRPPSPRRGKSRSPKRDNSRPPRRETTYRRGRTRSPVKERQRLPKRHGHWSPKNDRPFSPIGRRDRAFSPRGRPDRSLSSRNRRDRSLSPRSRRDRSLSPRSRRDRPLSPRDNRNRYSKRRRSRSVDRRSQSKSGSSRRDRSRYHKRGRSKSRSKSHTKSRRSKSTGREVVSKREFSKIYDKHVQSFQPFLTRPEDHPDYANWITTQTVSTPSSYALDIRLNWERRINELMNIAWKNLKKRYNVKSKRRKSSRSDSSSSASSSGVSKRKKSTHRKKVGDNKEGALKSRPASTASLSALVDEYVSQLPSQPSTSEYAGTSSGEIPQPQSDTKQWTSKSFVEVPSRHDNEPFTADPDTSYISRTSDNLPGHSTSSVCQPPPSYPYTRDNVNPANSTHSSLSLQASEPEVSSTSDRHSTKNLRIIEILKLLVQVKGKAGVVGETLPLVLNRVQSARDRGVRELSCFNSDDVILLGLIKNRLCQTSQEPHVSFIEKVIIDEAVSQLGTLMDMVQSALENRTSFFDINVLSQVTEKYSISESMTYIKNLLGEFKRPNSEDDVLPVFVELVKLRGAL